MMAKNVLRIALLFTAPFLLSACATWSKNSPRAVEPRVELLWPDGAPGALSNGEKD